MLDLIVFMAEQAQLEDPDESAAAMFVRILGVERHTAEILVANEVTTIEELASAPRDELVSIKQLDQSLILQIRERANGYLRRRAMGDE